VCISAKRAHCGVVLENGDWTEPKAIPLLCLLWTTKFRPDPVPKTTKTKIYFMEARAKTAACGYKSVMEISPADPCSFSSSAMSRSRLSTCLLFRGRGRRDAGRRDTAKHMVSRCRGRPWQENTAGIVGIGGAKTHVTQAGRVCLRCNTEGAAGAMAYRSCSCSPRARRYRLCSRLSLAHGQWVVGTCCCKGTEDEPAACCCCCDTVSPETMAASSVWEEAA